MAIALSEIVPWGRTAAEYAAMFNLEEMPRRILDCGGGPASFAAEMKARAQVTAADPVYTYSGGEIRSRFDTVAGVIMPQVRAQPDRWVWGFHQNPDSLLACRRTALDRFLADYENGREEGRYVAAELPGLPFNSGAFDLALCSHLLFLYSDALSEEFHIQAALELCRVAAEVRVFPLLTLRGDLSPFVEPVRKALAKAGRSTALAAAAYEFQPGGNQMLRIY